MVPPGTFRIEREMPLLAQEGKDRLPSRSRKPSGTPPMPTKPLLIAAAALGAALSPAAASASDWDFQVTPYLWIAGVDTSVGNFSRTASFGDILDNLSFTVMGTGEARRGRLLLVTDFVYLKLGTNKDLPAGAASIDGRLKSTIWTNYGGWRVFDIPSARVDLLAGFRLYDLSTRASLVSTGGQINLFEADKTFASPVFGPRVTLALSDRMFLRGAVDVGGFGLGSDLTWQGLAVVGYRFSPLITAEAGYRNLYVQRELAGRPFELGISGPILGVTFSF